MRTCTFSSSRTIEHTCRRRQREVSPISRSGQSWQTMPGKKQSPAAVPAITPPTEITAPPAQAGPPEPTNPDKPWGLKDTFRWLVSLLRSHNALLDSHIELQRTVNDLRQNILELARLPITAPIWCDPAIETIIQPPEAAPEEPLFPPEPPQQHAPEQIQPDEPDDAFPDKGPMDSQLWTDENIRYGLEQAPIARSDPSIQATTVSTRFTNITTPNSSEHHRNSRFTSEANIARQTKHSTRQQNEQNKRVTQSYTTHTSQSNATEQTNTDQQNNKTTTQTNTTWNTQSTT